MAEIISCISIKHSLSSLARYLKHCILGCLSRQVFGFCEYIYGNGASISFLFLNFSNLFHSVRSLSKSAGKRLTSSYSSSKSPLPPLPSRARTISGGGSKKLQVRYYLMELLQS